MQDARYTRSRLVIIAPEDEEAISAAIRQKFPAALFVEDRETDALPLRTMPSIARSGDIITHVQVPRDRREPGPASGRDDTDAAPPPLRCRYLRGRWRNVPDPPDAAYELPIPDYGSIDAAYAMEDKAQKRFIGQIWRIVARHTDNRMDVVDPVTLRMRPDGTNQFWVGHHMIRWCMESDRRVLWRILRPSPEAQEAAEAALAGRSAAADAGGVANRPRPHDAPR